jgi:DNA topoisomerase-1
MIQIGAAEDEEKPRFAKIPTGQSIETITFEQAMDLFRMQGILGQYEEKDDTVGIGRFGPYVKWGEEYVSIPRGTDPATVNLEKAIGLIREKQKADAPVGMYEGKPITKGKGRFGPFIKWEGMFINVPRRYNFDKLTQHDMDELIAAKVKKEENRFIQRWPDEKIAIENGRWGPFIRWGKKMIKLPRKADESKYTPEEAAGFTLDEVRKMIEAVEPGAFVKKEKKKSAPKKKAAKKSPSRKKKE